MLKGSLIDLLQYGSGYGDGRGQGSGYGTCYGDGSGYGEGFLSRTEYENFEWSRVGADVNENETETE